MTTHTFNFSKLLAFTLEVEVNESNFQIHLENSFLSENKKFLGASHKGTMKVWVHWVQLHQSINIGT